MNRTLLALPLAAVLVVTAVTMALAPAYASIGKAKGNPNFDITSVSGNTMTVAGTAGGTTPNDQRHVFAYVFVQSTPCGADLCAYAVTSHALEDSGQVGNDLTWHTHYVEVTGGCVTAISDAGTQPTLVGNTVTLNGLSSSTAAGVTAVLNIETDTGAVCIQTVLDFQPA